MKRINIRISPYILIPVIFSGISLLMVIAAVLVLVVVRAAGADAGMPGAVQ